MTAVEFRKQLIRVRTYVGLGLMILIPTILTLVFKFGNGPGRRNDNDLFALARHSGLNMPLAALSAMSTFLLPVVVLLFAGSAVSEESSWGSLRYLLVRPVSRSRLLASKLLVALVVALIATILITVTATLEGVLAFGWHPVITTSLTTISPGTALERLALSTLYVAWCLTGVISLSFMISTMGDAVMGAVAGGFGLTIVSEIMNAITPLGRIRSFLPTHYWHAWEALFTRSASSGDMVRGVLLQIPYVVVFLALAWWWFNRKDVLT